MTLLESIQNWRQRRADRALLKAAYSGNKKKAIQALDRGADVNAHDPSSYRTPLGMACWNYTNGHQLKYDDEKKNRAAHLLSVIQLIVEKGGRFEANYMNDISSKKCSPREAEARNELIQAINRQVIKKAADNDLEGVLDLIRNGYRNFNRLLDFAVSNDKPKIANIALIKSPTLFSPDLNLVLDGLWDEKLFMKAAWKGRTEIVKLMLDSVTNKNTKNRIVNQSHEFHLGWTPLLGAAANGHADVVKLLLENGADVHAQTRQEGKTSLSFAAEYGYAEVVKNLIDHGAKIDHVPPYFSRLTPLIYAAKNGHLNVVKLLAHAGADTSFQVPFSMKGFDLHMKNYAYRNRPQIAQEIQEQIKTFCPFENKTALEIADFQGHQNVVQFLKEIEVKEKTRIGKPTQELTSNQGKSPMKEK